MPQVLTIRAELTSAAEPCMGVDQILTDAHGTILWFGDRPFVWDPAGLGLVPIDVATADARWKGVMDGTQKEAP